MRAFLHYLVCFKDGVECFSDFIEINWNWNWIIPISMNSQFNLCIA